MTSKYDVIVEALQEKIDRGEISLENAEKVNTLAFEKYCGSVVEESSDDNKDLELIDELRALIEEGKVKLSKDDVKCIKKLIKDADSDDDKDDEKKDEESKDDVAEDKASEEEAPAESEEPAAEE